MIKKWQFILTFAALLLFGCTQQPAPGNIQDQPVVSVGEATAVIVPPTFTPLSPEERLMTIEPQVTVTQRAIPTVATNTPIPFGETAVELHYRIPAIGLDRRMQGNISSQIIIADELTGDIIKRDNQSGVLIELQQTLPNLVLEPLPENCLECVYISYDLPFADLSGEGWFKDPAILASIDNYLTLSLGPHFPPNTVMGLRRNASPYAPAHTIAILEDGSQYSWLATDYELDAPSTVAPSILETLNLLDLEQLGTQYEVTCPGAAAEMLFLYNGETSRWILINCPEYALPTSLLPIYKAIDGALAEKLLASDAVEARPPALFPLDALLQYNRVDGAQLTIFDDSTAIAVSPANETITTTLSSTAVLSLTTSLIDSNQLKLGLTSFSAETSDSGNEGETPTPRPPRSILLVRGPDGVYDGFWDETANVPLLATLNELLTELFGETLEEAIDETPTAGTPDPEATETPIEPEATEIPIEEELATATPEP